MQTISIREIDKQVNAGKNISAEQAVRNVEHHIVEKVDSDFPVEEFHSWVNSDSEKPFRNNKKRYIW